MSPTNTAQIAAGVLAQTQIAIFFTPKFGISIGADGGFYFNVDMPDINTGKGELEVYADKFIATASFDLGFALR